MVRLAVHQPNATSRPSDIPLRMLEDKCMNEADAARVCNLAAAVIETPESPSLRTRSRRIAALRALPRSNFAPRLRPARLRRCLLGASGVCPRRRPARTHRRPPSSRPVIAPLRTNPRQLIHRDNAGAHDTFPAVLDRGSRSREEPAGAGKWVIGSADARMYEPSVRVYHPGSAPLGRRSGDEVLVPQGRDGTRGP